MCLYVKFSEAFVSGRGEQTLVVNLRDPRGAVGVQGGVGADFHPRDMQSSHESSPAQSSSSHPPGWTEAGAPLRAPASGVGKMPEGLHAPFGLQESQRQKTVKEMRQDERRKMMNQLLSHLDRLIPPDRASPLCVRRSSHPC